MARKAKTPTSKNSRAVKQRRVLLGLVDYYLRTGQPVGSNTLKDGKFQDLSSATIRNYFADLEGQGLLHQLHASGGRLPTHKAIRLYIDEYLHSSTAGKAEQLFAHIDNSGRDICLYLEEMANRLSRHAHLAVFLSAPRFDHDIIQDIHFLHLDSKRCLAVIVTEFGSVNSELLQPSFPLTKATTQQIEQYCRARLIGEVDESLFPPDFLQQAQPLYNELILRYVVGYSHFSEEGIYKTGFSELISYPEYSDVVELSKSLHLFENKTGMRHLLREGIASDSLKCWVGEDLLPYTSSHADCAVLTIPYKIHNRPVGAIGLLGPTRLPYKQLFSLLKGFSKMLSTQLSQQTSKQQISYRQPDAAPLIGAEEKQILLEDQS